MREFRNSCIGRCKLNRETNLIPPLEGHNHGLAEYKSKLKTKCKTIAKDSLTTSEK